MIKEITIARIIENGKTVRRRLLVSCPNCEGLHAIWEGEEEKECCFSKPRLSLRLGTIAFGSAIGTN